MTELPARLVAALADRYRIERELGAGGMATVYLAHDLKHDRDVAIKVLHPDLGAALGGERFLTEIRTTARLQHPHILPLLDSGEADGLLYYVMPVVTGETLRARLEREHQLPIADAVRIAREVASALDYAHRQGVVHRDIKPENILLHDGSALVADFGIALAVQTAGGQRMTQTGLSLGTPSYMSPEQAMGEKTIDARSDVYALGAVTYEMLTGDAPFTGSTVQAIVAKVLNADAERPSMLRKTIPSHVEAAVMTALAKLPADRFASAAAFSEALDGRGDARRDSSAQRVSASRRPWRRIAIASTSAALVFAAVAAWGVFARPAVGAGRVEFGMRLAPGGSQNAVVAISPDGRKIAQIATDSAGVDHVVVRELASPAVTVITGTDAATTPEFSLDGQWISFGARGKLWKVPVAGGPATLVADSANASAAWCADGTIVYLKPGLGLWRVSAAGGTGTRLTSLDTVRREFAHWNPQELPGGKAILFNAFSTPLTRSRIEAVAVASGKRTVLVEGAIYARYVESGHLLYARDGAVFAVPFDPSALRVLGPEVPVLTDVVWSATNGSAAYAVSRTGTLVYLKASESAVSRRVLWVDRAGNEQPALPEAGQWAEPRISPNGRWIAITRLEPSWQVWLYDRTRSALSQLTNEKGVAFSPVWMPDGRSLIHVVETPVYDLRHLPIDGGKADTLRVSKYDKLPTAVSPDGRTLLYSEVRDRAVLMVAPFGPGAAVPFDASESSQANASIAPNGRWVAYEADNPQASSEVYVRAFDGRGGRRQVSTGGGSQPRFTRGGREIVFRNGADVLAATFNPSTGDVGAPSELFRRKDVARLSGSRGVGYDVLPDGSRFLVVVPIDRPDALPTTVVLNWLDELKAKVKR
ncbi:MAG: protein kinase domain-containing protein [Gemmatimonadaceae bacterium]